jgi:hypothetical protein
MKPLLGTLGENFRVPAGVVGRIDPLEETRKLWVVGTAERSRYRRECYPISDGPRTI